MPDGSKRQLRPSCSGGPVVDGNGDKPKKANRSYSFFISEGKPDKILISLDGGGACWDAATCLLSPLQPELFGGRPTYVPDVDETTENLAQAGGILDSNNPDNPYKDYTKIFVPYCSGDIHWGSKNTTYNLPMDDGKTLKWKIHHRGTDNFLAVLDWLQRNDINFENASDVSVAGASAGGYGANLAFAYVAELTSRKTKLSLVSDSAIGVFDNPQYPGTLPFYTTAIYNPAARGTESWGVARNLPSWAFGDRAHVEAFLNQGANYRLGFVPSIFATLGRYKREANLATVTTNLDAVQIGFYTLMKGPFNEDPPALSARQWYRAMARMTATTASLPNYRFLIDNGACHTFIFTENFYSQGVSKWISAMLDPRKGWDSINSGRPNPPGPLCPQLP